MGGRYLTRTKEIGGEKGSVLDDQVGHDLEAKKRLGMGG